MTTDHKFNPRMEVLDALRSYTQADDDGVMVLVSRQACDEAVNEIERLRRANDHLVACIHGISRQCAEMAKANSE